MAKASVLCEGSRSVLDLDQQEQQDRQEQQDKQEQQEQQERQEQQHQQAEISREALSCMPLMSRVTSLISASTLYSRRTAEGSLTCTLLMSGVRQGPILSLLQRSPSMPSGALLTSRAMGGCTGSRIYSHHTYAFVGGTDALTLNFFEEVLVTDKT